MADQEKTPAPEGNTKLIIIIGGAIAALIIIVGVVVLLAGRGKSEEKGEKASSASTEKKGGKEGGGAPTIHPLDPFIVNIYDGQEIRYLRVKVEFEMASPEAMGELDGRLAPVRDAILVLLTTKTLQDIQDLRGKNQLREEILLAVNKILPPGKVTKVYFTEFVVQ